MEEEKKCLIDLPYELILYIASFLTDEESYLLMCTTPKWRKPFINDMMKSFDGYTKIRDAWFCETQRNKPIYTKVAPFLWNAPELIFMLATFKFDKIMKPFLYEHTIRPHVYWQNHDMIERRMIYFLGSLGYDKNRIATMVKYYLYDRFYIFQLEIIKISIITPGGNLEFYDIPIAKIGMKKKQYEKHFEDVLVKGGFEEKLRDIQKWPMRVFQYKDNREVVKCEIDFIIGFQSELLCILTEPIDLERFINVVKITEKNDWTETYFNEWFEETQSNTILTLNMNKNTPDISKFDSLDCLK